MTTPPNKTFAPLTIGLGCFGIFFVVVIFVMAGSAVFNYHVYKTCLAEGHSKTYCYALTNGRAVAVEQK
jgi:hypothetical protein